MGPILLLSLLLVQQRPLSAIVDDLKKLVTELEQKTSIIEVKPTDDLQAAINNAKPGDTLLLTPQGRYIGPFTLPPKAGQVIIKTSSILPDGRISPDNASLLPIISSSTGPVISGIGATGYKLLGIKFESVPSGVGEILSFENSRDIFLEKILIIAGTNGQKRAIRGNGNNINLTDSYISGIFYPGQDSQAFCAWNGSGPYSIINNFLEAASENVMFGGSDSSSVDKIPADILVSKNYFSKPLQWKGTGKAVKNLFELKVGKRVTITENTFDTNYTDAQSGYGISLKVVNQNGTNNYNVLEDVLFEKNILKNSENGINILGHDYEHPSGSIDRLSIKNNLIITSGVAFQIGGESKNINIEHNTVVNGYNIMNLYFGTVWIPGEATTRPGLYSIDGFTFSNNITYHNDYGIKGQGTGIGIPSLTKFIRNLTWTINVLAGNSGNPYPTTSLYPSINELNSNFDSSYVLLSTSQYKNAGSDKQDLGRLIH